jgi:hypothetical protein
VAAVLPEEETRLTESFDHPRQSLRRFADVERRVDVAAEHVEIIARHAGAAGDLPEQQEILLADRFGIFVYRAAEVA